MSEAPGSINRASMPCARIRRRARSIRASRSATAIATGPPDNGAGRSSARKDAIGSVKAEPAASIPASSVRRRKGSRISIGASPLQGITIGRAGWCPGEPGLEPWIAMVENGPVNCEFEREAHHHIGCREGITGKPVAMGEFRLEPCEMGSEHPKQWLTRRASQQAQAVDDEKAEQGRHHRPLGIMEELAPALPLNGIARWAEPPALPDHQIVDDGARLDEGVAIDLDNRRFAEGVDVPQRRRREHRLRIALVALDLIGQAEFLD